MRTLDLFPTQIHLSTCDLDLDDLENACYEHKNKNKSAVISNKGGYQGHNFVYQPLIECIKNGFPVNPHKPIKDFSYNMWININGKNNWNDWHDHDSYTGTFLSGVFYVKTPVDSGKIRFLDPRQYITKAPDMKYYNDGNYYHYIDPQPNLLIMFPGWLYHSVEPNNSDEDRISISFNIVI